MNTAREDLVKALGEVADAATQLAASATHFAAAIRAEQPTAQIIGPAMENYGRLTGKSFRVRLEVVSEAAKRWVLLNPGLTQEKFR